MRIRGLLLDLEGVLYQEGKAIEGAPEALRELLAQGLEIRGLTNTTTQPRRAIAGRMKALGLALPEAVLFTPPIAAGAALRLAGVRRLHLAAPRELAEDFAGFALVEEEPEAVVLGDLYRGFTWDRLNQLFSYLREGARLIALHKNRVSRREGEIALDLGPFVAALEYASGQEALVVGKPCRDFFELALADMNLSPAEVTMVGDDIEADIAGAQSAGLSTIQVQTGKYTAADSERTGIQPGLLIDSIAELPQALLRSGS